MKKILICILILLQSCITVSKPVLFSEKGSEPNIPFSGKTYRLEFVNETKNLNILKTVEYKIMKESILRNLEKSVNIDKSGTEKKFIRIQIFGRNDPEKSSGTISGWVSLFTFMTYPTVKTKVYDVSFLIKNDKKIFHTYRISNTTYTSSLLFPFFWVSSFTNNLNQQMNSVMEQFLNDAQGSW